MTVHKYKFQGKIIYNIADRSLHGIFKFCSIMWTLFFVRTEHTQKFLFKQQNKTLLSLAFTVRKLECNLTRKLAFVKYQLH